MKSRTFGTLFLLASLFVVAGQTGAEDIDIYAGTNSDAKSNVLVVIDNSGAWNASSPYGSLPANAACQANQDSSIIDTSGGFEACGLYNALEQIKTTPVLLNKLKMGLMLYGQGNVQGGVFRRPGSAPFAFPVLDSSGITNMQTSVMGLKSGAGADNNTANSVDVGGAMQEAWAYYTGHTGMSGTSYSALTGDVCGKNYVIFIGISRSSSNPNDSNSNNVLAELVNAGATTEQQAYITTTSQYDKYFVQNSNWGDEWTRFNRQAHSIITYTITLKDTDQPNPDYVQFTESMALQGGGKAFVVSLGDMTALVQALIQIFNEIQAVNSVFASASLPLSANAQGTFKNQVFMGMFRPDATGQPRWMGNLKQYQFGVDDSDPQDVRLFLADSTGASAISAAGSGFISPNAISFWTKKDLTAQPDSSGGFWRSAPQGVALQFDSPDGEVVEKGGAAQQIRLENLLVNYTANPATPRRLYTCTSGTEICAAGTLLSATPFATTNDGVTAQGLGAQLPATPIQSITRTSATATVTLQSAMSPALTSGQSVVISGSQYPKFNGVFAAGGPPTATTFTYPVVVVPPATATGSYTASIPSNPQNIISLTRSDTTATATVPLHGYANGQPVTVSGATSGYNIGSAAITFVDANTFTYTINVSPVTPGGGGTASVGTTTRTIDTVANSGIARTGSIGAGPDFIQNVNVRTTANHGFAAGDTVTIAGTTPSDYDGTYTITGVGNSCTGAGNPANRYFCFNKATTPTSPAGTTGQVSPVGATSTITSLTRSDTCTGGTPSPVATVTAVTSAAHSFVTGNTVTIAPVGSPTADEDLYQGNHSVTVTSTTSFTYTITTSPACSDNTAGMTASAFAVERDTLIRWVRGQDNKGDEPSPDEAGTTINIRPSIHGDVLHSRPTVIDYGDPTGTVVFYGANDGVFRAANGNQSASIGSVPPGGELWGFIPTEFFSKFPRLYFNSPVIKLSSTSDAIVPTPTPKDYFFDGSTGVYRDLATGTTYIFLSARRGGRLIYALDVTDPAAPRFLWKHSSAETDFSELGQTWSAPRVALVKGNTNPVLIFGAGYDPKEDAEPPAADTMGRGIFILDAITGNLLWRAGPGGDDNHCVGTPCELQDMTYAMPSDVTLLDRNGDGFVDRIYAPDLGGNMWRVDLERAGCSTPPDDCPPGTWQASKFAAVGGTGTTRRKIFFPPDVVSTKDFDAVLFATGDREHPTISHQSVSILNRFYMLKDTKVGNDACTPVDGNPTCPDPITDDTPAVVADWTPATDPVPTCDCLFNASPVLPTSASSEPTTPGAPYDQTGNGFYITLKNAVATKNADGSITYGPAIENGEKSVNAPTTVGGRTFFGTNAPIPPDPSICQANLGTARGYSIDLLTGESRFVVFEGGGLPPSPVTGLVTIGDTDYPFIIGGGDPTGDCVGPDCKSSLGGGKPPIPIVPVRSRTYWYRDLDK